MSDLTSDKSEIEFVTNSQIEGSGEGDLIVEMRDEKIVVSKNDRSLAELYRWFDRRKLVVDPEWQREYVWDNRRASKLIESVLIEIPIPIIYLAQTAEGHYEVIDGLQRLTSVFNFFRGEYALRGLEIRTDLNGKSFNELDTSLQNRLEDATFRTFELAASNKNDLMFLIFERLNTGGVALNDMEIRNCLYRGGLNSLLKELRSQKEFVDCLNMQNISKRMLDRSLVLRFLAFYERTPYKAKNGLKSFLNEFMEIYRNPAPAKLSEFRAAFAKSMRCCYTVFGEHGFRVLRDRTAGGSEWAPRPNAAIFQTVAVPFASYDIGQVTRVSDAIFEEYLDLVSCDQRWVDAVTKSTGDYQNIEYATSTWNFRLSEVLKDSVPNDKNRVFSKELKKSMFLENPTCRLCGQEIKLINDAAMDHDRHYWRGGKTVPSNARLVHRFCNFSRPD